MMCAVPKNIFYATEIPFLCKIKSYFMYFTPQRILTTREENFESILNNEIQL